MCVCGGGGGGGANTFRGSGSVIFILAFLLKGINSKRKEFAPVGANSFL